MAPLVVGDGDTSTDGVGEPLPVGGALGVGGTLGGVLAGATDGGG
jgi:hypothetical protein